jgi:hypothetical protein
VKHARNIPYGKIIAYIVVIALAGAWSGYAWLSSVAG